MREQTADTVGRRIIGNLDFEVELTRVFRAPPQDRPRASGRPALPPAVLASISAMATLLRVFARDGDRLWTPAPVASHRLPAVPGLPAPTLESGPLEQLPACRQALVWGEPAHPGRQAPTPREAETREPATPDKDPGGIPLHVLPWMMPRPSPETAARVNDRSFGLEIAQNLGVALPGARMVRDFEELRAHLRAGGAQAAPGESWVVKAPLSAAGRSRLRQRGRNPDERARRRIESLLEVYGELLFEPWMERAADFGCVGFLGCGTHMLLPVHTTLMTPGGGFRGVEVSCGPQGATRCRPEEQHRMLESVEAVACRLGAAGYTGPFTVDCWRYRDARGSLRFHPLGEINGRMSFGLVAAALAARLVESGSVPDMALARLVVSVGGRSHAWKRSGEHMPLLLPSPKEPTAAWLEVG